ncbi:endonuclease domain-containing protein [Quatrionicoccus australiensis]|uniref:endonuclease domain-containing protein n=1 Tax=Quatrionicoccus australiensis TaxID=138118 RepID=UPI001CFA9A08|nr:endonuclease domain-containing protein [Quatrionicoccus australiensis]MCB4358560.1 endonuclease domain-containing protein [Quatrionicoccus australiensis]
MKRSIRDCFGLEMVAKTLTPPSPPLSGGGYSGDGSTATPSPDKGRAGEGFEATIRKNKFLSYDQRLTAFARTNRQQPTPAENLIWQKVLRNRQFFGHKFLRQKPIGPYVVDFYCAELNLAIEIDGDSHAEQQDYDAKRTAFLESHGLRVLRYPNREILNNLPGVYEHLQQQLEQTQS